MKKTAKRKVKLPKKPNNLFLVVILALVVVCGVVVYAIISRGPGKVPKAATDPYANNMDSVIYDLTSNHDGKICGVTGYDWELHAANQGGVPGSGFTKGTGWGVFQWDCNAGPVANVTIETQNIKGYVFNGTWNQITDHVSWCSLTDQTTATNVGDCPGGGLTGPAWQMPNSKVALHWASDHNNLPSGVTCAFTTLQARITGAGAAGAFVMGGSGFDYWNTANTAIDPSFVGRYKRLNGDWQWINGSSCSTTTIQNNPPPGVVTTSTATSPTPTPVTVNSPTPTPVTSSGSFKEDFFNNTTLSGTAVTSQSVATINNNWGLSAPVTGLPADNFSIRWAGTFNFDGSKYRFNASADDGVRVKVDGQTVLDGWKNQATTSYNKISTLSGSHNVTVEYYDGGWDAVAKANWVHADRCFDMTGDGIVDDSDLKVLTDHWSSSRSNSVSAWDLNNDRKVNSLDQLLLVKQKGTTCS